MHTVPSLIGTGTVVAAAATGLAFGQPNASNESNTFSSVRPSPPKRKILADFSFDNPRAMTTSSWLPRPGTSSSPCPYQLVEEPPKPSPDQQRHPSPLASHPVNAPRQTSSAGPRTTPSLPSSRRQSYIRAADVPTTAESARESSSSHGSWIRRLSLRPNSPHSSPRSSFGPETALSASQSLGPAALSPTTFVTPPLPPPNKLVKRSGHHESIFSRRGSRTQVPTVRRPATSHQRSPKAHQPLSPTTNMALDSSCLGHQQSRPRASTTGQTNSASWRQQDIPNWTSYFHARRLRISRRSTVIAANDNTPSESSSLGNGLHTRRGSLPRPYLVHPHSICGDRCVMRPREAEPNKGFPDPVSPRSTQSPRGTREADPPRMTPAAGVRRSLPTQLSSSGRCTVRAGSLDQQRKSAEHSSDKRHASDPIPASSPNAARTCSSKPKTVMSSISISPKSGGQGQVRNATTFVFQEPNRDSLSSVPPKLRLSDLPAGICNNLDLSHPPSAVMPASSLADISPTGAPQGAPISSHSRAVSKEGACTLAGSEMSVPGLASGDDDDTDYKSDAVWDSFRTSDSNMLRTIESPLESMFEEFSHGIARITNSERLSFREISGNSWDGRTKIMEENGASPTSSRGGMHDTHVADEITKGDDRATEIAKYQISIGNNRIATRMSLDTTDDDHDWARNDDDGLGGKPPSPPATSPDSRSSSSAQQCLGSANISDEVSPLPDTLVPSMEGPRSNLFDWSEPSIDKSDDGSSRPRTAHGKEALDLRGGRPTNRKGILANHIRSQSLPVAPDPREIVKGKLKFRTRGTSVRNDNDDWEADFEFDEGSNSGCGPQATSTKFSVQVPESIQSTQATVMAHSVHIRELSLLVGSLKRLCRQGRDLRLTDGSKSSLWKEAENIIALAYPDDDDMEGNVTARSSSEFDPLAIDERFLDEGFDSSSLDRPLGETGQPDIPKNAVVRERQIVRRRSVFPSDDDIFGNNWPSDREGSRPHTPKGPERVREFHTCGGTVVSSVIAAMEQQRSESRRRPDNPLKPSKAKLFFDTNSLQELVKRASTIYHALTDLVRNEDPLTMNSRVTPKHDGVRLGESPAFTRVFSEPDPSPPRHLVRSRKSGSPRPRNSLDSSGFGQRMQMMTVN